jgi:hypothetical protein
VVKGAKPRVLVVVLPGDLSAKMVQKECKKSAIINIGQPPK